MKYKLLLRNFRADFWYFFQMSQHTGGRALKASHVHAGHRSREKTSQPTQGDGTGMGREPGSQRIRRRWGVRLPSSTTRLLVALQQAITASAFCLNGLISPGLKSGRRGLEYVINAFKISWLLVAADQMCVNSISKERGCCVSSGRDRGRPLAFAIRAKCKKKYQNPGEIHYFSKFLSAITVPSLISIY